MDTFKCYEYGLTSTDQVKVNEHMAQSHGVKVVNEELEKHNFCSQCNYTSSNMGKFKNHMKKDHGKGEHNWWTEDIRSEFYCKECQIKFPQRTLLKSHMEENHNSDHKMEDRKTKPDDNNMNVKKDSHINVEEDKFPCDKCQRVFLKKQAIYIWIIFTT